MDVVRVLQQVDLFRGLDTEQLARVGEIANVEDFHEGQLICQQGDAADKMYVISKGQVEISLRSSNGDEQPMLYLGAGQVVGEMTLVDEGRRSASVIAAEDGTLVYSIPNTSLTTLCQENTAIGYAIMRNIAQDLSFKLRHRDFDPAEANGNGSHGGGA